MQQDVSTKTVVPFRYAAWLRGDLGKVVENEIFKSIIRHAPDINPRVTLMLRGVMVETSGQTPGQAVDLLLKVVEDLEACLEYAYPIFYKEFGQAWTGVLQSIQSGET